MGTRAITQIPATFLPQSWFSADYAGALATQAPGDAIVSSTRREAQTPGVAVALHPASESPVAVRFRGGSADSATLVLTPGQVFHVGDFKSFEWGLPFGWLGGGTVLLYVLHTPEAKVDFAGLSTGPVIFHRLRIPVEAVGANPTPANWPGAFPWPSAARTIAPAMLQGGTAIVPLTMAHAMFRLGQVVEAPVPLVLVWTGADPLDIGPTGAVAAGKTLYELTFPASIGASAAGAVAWIPPEVHELTGGATVMQVMDPSGTYVGQTVDVVRYCRF